MSRLAAYVVAGALAIGVGTCYGAQSCTYSEGARAGNVIKFSEKGWVFKTHEGQLALTVDSNTDEGRGRGIWEFTVADKDIEARVQEALESGRKVKLTYEERLWVPFWKGDTDYLVTNVEYVGEDKKPISRNNPYPFS